MLFISLVNNNLKFFNHICPPFLWIIIDFHMISYYAIFFCNYSLFLLYEIIRELLRAFYDFKEPFKNNLSLVSNLQNQCIVFFNPRFTMCCLFFYFYYFFYFSLLIVLMFFFIGVIIFFLSTI